MITFIKLKLNILNKLSYIYFKINKIDKSITGIIYI